MPIYASVWTGTGTEADPRRPLAIEDPTTETWRGVASLPDLSFINYTPGAASRAESGQPAGVLILAPDLDTTIGTTNAINLTKMPFKFPAQGTETPRDIAHRIGVWFAGEVRP